jgi:hypothetical protein
MPVRIRYKYETDDEILYIQSIGRTHLNTVKLSRKELLKQYIDACKMRTDWSGLDKAAIISFANEEFKGAK